MAEVIGFKPKVKQPTEDEIHYDKQTRILNTLEEEYELGGIIIAITEDGIHMSVAVEDYGTARNALVSAMIQFIEGSADDTYSD
jgi:hypothetical protein